MQRYRITLILLLLGLPTTLANDRIEGGDSKPQVSPSDIRLYLSIARDDIGVRVQTIRPKGPVQNALDELFGATTHAELQGLPGKWRKDLPKRLRNELIQNLLRRMESRKAMKFQIPDDVVVLIKPYVSDDATQRHFKAQQAGKPVASYQHDIYIEGGRCAWALAELLHLELFKIYEPLSNEDLAVAVRENTFLVMGAMLTPDEIDFDSMDAPKRRELASRTGNRVLLWRMSKDLDRDVRHAIAKRSDVGYVDEQILFNLEHDRETEISNAAKASWKTYFDEKAGIKPRKE